MASYDEVTKLALELSRTTYKTKRTTKNTVGRKNSRRQMGQKYAQTPYTNQMLRQTTNIGAAIFDDYALKNTGAPIVEGRNVDDHRRRTTSAPGDISKRFRTDTPATDSEYRQIVDAQQYTTD